MFGHAPALPIGVDPLIAEAKQRARRRRRLLALAAAGVVAAAAATGGVAISSGGGGMPGAIPWLQIRPDLGPANPPLAPACAASQLEATLSTQGAAGNLAGGLRIVNRSSTACALVGRPKLSLGHWRFTRWHQGAASPFDPLAPPIGSLRALRPGEHVLAQLWIPGYCEMLPATNSRLRPLVLTAPGGGTIGLEHATFPDCNVPAGLTVQETRYTPYVPEGPRSSALPLKASIVSGRPVTIKGKTLTQPTFVARRGSWLSYTVVLTNRSAEPFRFGRTCPAYTEDWGGVARAQAYVLNCHAVGAIAPDQSVEFAMRIRVPNIKLRAPAFGWTLAPHTYDAPSAMGVVELR